MWQTVDLRELRLFLTLAEELHFGRTAERLRLTPSRVSQSLRALEHKLGAQLVHRTSRRVRLTPFGERFAARHAAGARAARRCARADERRGADARRARSGSALLSGPAGGPHLVEIIRAFEARHPECKVEVVQLVMGRSRSAQLRESDVDLDGDLDPTGAARPGRRADPHQPAPRPRRRPRPSAGGSRQRRRRGARGSPGLALRQLAEGAPRGDGALADPRRPSDPLHPRSRSASAASRPSRCGSPAASSSIPTVASAPSYLGDLELVFVPITGMPPLRSALVWRRPAREPRAPRVHPRRPRGASSLSAVTPSRQRPPARRLERARCPSCEASAPRGRRRTAAMRAAARIAHRYPSAGHGRRGAARGDGRSRSSRRSRWRRRPPAS